MPCFTKFTNLLKILDCGTHLQALCLVQEQKCCHTAFTHSLMGYKGWRGVDLASTSIACGFYLICINPELITLNCNKLRCPLFVASSFSPSLSVSLCLICCQVNCCSLCPFAPPHTPVPVHTPAPPLVLYLRPAFVYFWFSTLPDWFFFPPDMFSLFFIFWSNALRVALRFVHNFMEMSVGEGGDEGPTGRVVSSRVPFCVVFDINQGVIEIV